MRLGHTANRCRKTVGVKRALLPGEPLTRHVPPQSIRQTAPKSKSLPRLACRYLGRYFNRAAPLSFLTSCRRTPAGVAAARALRERIPADYRCRATRSNFWLAYDAVFPRRTHRLCGKAEGETCHVERWNNTLRQRLGRFVRKTLFLLQVRPGARSGSALVHPPLQPLTCSLTTTRSADPHHL